ncbi:MAG: type II toxin-antitoxin system prevent-host-death family antitoxin [Balneolaceae bacterium]|nr:type II toxin-antitoxin system prevent-host-death family antitoxin [Balneolaceae bacterium]
MQVINVRQPREKLSSLLDMVAAGEEIAIVRHGKPAARLVAPQAERVQFIDGSELRASLPPAKESAAQVICNLRQEERY